MWRRSCLYTEAKGFDGYLSHLCPLRAGHHETSGNDRTFPKLCHQLLTEFGQGGIAQVIVLGFTICQKDAKPDKIYLQNPNLLYAIASAPVQIGTARETFVVNQLSVNHNVEYGKTKGDFIVDHTYTFEVGGADKTFKQIADLPDSFILADNMEFASGKKLPLWIVGLTY